MIIKFSNRFVKNDICHAEGTTYMSEAFEKSKEALFLAPILQTPNWENLSLSFTDLSREIVDAILA